MEDITITFRRAAIEDAEKIAALQSKSFSCPATTEQIEREICSGSSAVFLAEANGETVAAADYTFVLDEGYVGNIVVAEAYRHRGIGHTLLDALISSAEKAGLAFLTLEVRPSNLSAVSLYRSAGFVSVGTRKKYYQNPTEDAMIMTRFFKR